MHECWKPRFAEECPPSATWAHRLTFRQGSTPTLLLSNTVLALFVCSTQCIQFGSCLYSKVSVISFLYIAFLTQVSITSIFSQCLEFCCFFFLFHYGRTAETETGCCCLNVICSSRNKTFFYKHLASDGC